MSDDKVWRNVSSSKHYDWTKVPPVVEQWPDSTTEPNQVYTNEELIKMHVRGVLPQYDRSAVVLPDQSDGFNPEVVARMDRIERERWARETLEKAKEQEKVAAKQKEEAEKVLKEERKKKAKERKEARENELLAKLEKRQKGG